MGRYDRGEVPRITETVKNLAGALVDPSAILVRVRAPGAAEVTYTTSSTPAIVKDGTGLYHVDVPASSSGTWRYRWETTNPDGADEGFYFVRSDFA